MKVRLVPHAPRLFVAAASRSSCSQGQRWRSWSCAPEERPPRPPLPRRAPAAVRRAPSPGTRATRPTSTRATTPPTGSSPLPRTSRWTGRSCRAAGDSLAGQPSILSLLVIRHGHLVYERYYHGSARDQSNNVHSASKSILQALVSIAIQQGAIGSWDDRVSTYLPEYFAGARAGKRQMTIRHLMTMSSGLRWIEDGTEYRDPGEARLGARGARGPASPPPGHPLPLQHRQHPRRLRRAAAGDRHEDLGLRPEVPLRPARRHGRALGARPAAASTRAATTST